MTTVEENVFIRGTRVGIKSIFNRVDSWRQFQPQARPPVSLEQQGIRQHTHTQTQKIWDNLGLGLATLTDMMPSVSSCLLSGLDQHKTIPFCCLFSDSVPLSFWFCSLHQMELVEKKCHGSHLHRCSQLRLLSQLFTWFYVFLCDVHQISQYFS